MENYRRVKKAEDIIEAIEFLIDNECDATTIETYRLRMGGGMSTSYEWSLDENGDIALHYMGKHTTIPRDTFIEEWDEQYSKSMFYPPLNGSLLTILSDEDSWVGGAGARVYEMDSRFELAIYTCSGNQNLISKLDALAAPVADIETMMQMIGSLQAEDVNAAFEVALLALSNPSFKSSAEGHLDMELDALKSKLTKHMSMSNNE